MMRKAFPISLYVYTGTVLSVYDGDTLRVNMHLGFSVSVEASLRLLGCNAIELHAPGGAEARQFLADLLPPTSLVLLHTVKPDKFGGRYDAQVTLPDGRDLVAVLIAAGYAAAWDGAGPKPVPTWPLAAAPTPAAR